MSILRSMVSVFILLAFSTVISLSIQAQQQTNRNNARQVSNMLQRLERSSSRFRNSLNLALVQRSVDQTQPQNDVSTFEYGFELAIKQFRDQFTRRLAVASDVESILQKASPLNRFMTQNNLNSRARNDWASVRTDLNTLASAYGVHWQWTQPTAMKVDPNGSFPLSESESVNKSPNRLTGTFKLDPSRSDNPRDKAQRATRNLRADERQEVAGQILARLESPERLMIERRGTTMTIASSLAPQSTFEADGRERQEQLSNGRWTKVTATLRGEQLVVSSNGYKNNDFTVTFDASENDRSLRVRREIYSDQLTQPVVVDSVYDRTADVGQWGSPNDSQPVLGNANTPNGELIVRDGENLVAVLNNNLTTKLSQQGDLFTMTVRDPSQFEGAVIEGAVSSVDQGGRLSGRSGLSLNFERIRLRNGQTYKFSGVLGSVRLLNGDTVKVDNEGSAQGSNQTTQTIQRTGIGTAVGVLIGAIAGGGKGAAIGGIIGAVGGAGTVFVQGKDNLELPVGTELTIRASGPR